MEQILSDFNFYPPDWVYLIFSSISSFLFTFFAIPTIVKISKLKGLFDYPGERKNHETATPLLGGLAVFAGFVISCTVFSQSDGFKTLFYLFGGLVIITVVGLKDDILLISPFKKLTGQFLAASVVVILGNIRITSFQDILSIGDLSYLSSIVFSILLLLLFTVSFNLIDGVDGLASGIGIIASIFFGVWFYLNDNFVYSMISSSISASLIAFFRFNVFSTKNKIFLGDTGAMITGFISGVLTIVFIQAHLSNEIEFKFEYAPFISIGLFFIPLFDTIRMIIIRIPDRNLFKASRNHIHHVVLQTGISHFKATLIIISLNSVILLSLLLLQRLGALFLTVYSLTISVILFFALQIRIRYTVKSSEKHDK